MHAALPNPNDAVGAIHRRSGHAQEKRPCKWWAMYRTKASGPTRPIDLWSSPTLERIKLTHPALLFRQKSELPSVIVPSTFQTIAKRLQQSGKTSIEWLDCSNVCTLVKRTSLRTIGGLYSVPSVPSWHSSCGFHASRHGFARCSPAEAFATGGAVSDLSRTHEMQL